MLYWQAGKIGVLKTARSHKSFFTILPSKRPVSLQQGTYDLLTIINSADTVFSSSSSVFINVANGDDLGNHHYITDKENPFLISYDGVKLKDVLGIGGAVYIIVMKNK